MTLDHVGNATAAAPPPYPARKGEALSAARILVTGFGGFPGARKNPTARMIAELAHYRPQLARTGICLELAVLPVVYAEIGPRLEALAQKIRPDAMLHFGVAPRRTRLCVEARALNRVSLLHPDASGARPARREIIEHGPKSLKATLPCGQIAAALRRRGFDAAVSIDAGDYVCNETLFRSLHRSHAPQNRVPLVGFIHVPGRRGGLTAARLTLAAATIIRALAPGVRRARRPA
jgi:pyroglutamyl-peptidase